MLRASVLAIAMIVFATGRAHADDEQLRLYGEPTSYTNVIDAFDDDDAFDLHAHVGFERTIASGTIQREKPRADGRSTRNFDSVAGYERVRNTLVLGIDVGLYKDLAVYARVPVILSDDQKLTLPSGRSAADVASDLSVPAEGSSQALFSVPFTSPTRFGVDHLVFGAAYAIFNQFRDPQYPTWIWMFEAHIGIGEPMHACYSDKPDMASARCYGGGEAGVGEGLNTFRLETRASHRFRYLEPYVGLGFELRTAGKSSDLFTTGGDLSGYVNTEPPQVGSLALGAALIPWEQRERSQRLTVDLRFLADYVSEGHGYTPITDALGSSQSDALRSPVLECATCSAQDKFVGLTDTQAHARLGGRLAVEMQAAQYVRFVLAATVAYSTPYLLTGADPCNTDAGSGGDDPRTGACRSGITNPHHRPAIDLPGERFKMIDEVSIDLFAMAVAQF